jgi:hypothetical protein
MMAASEGGLEEPNNSTGLLDPKTEDTPVTAGQGVDVPMGSESMRAGQDVPHIEEKPMTLWEKVFGRKKKPQA